MNRAFLKQNNSWKNTKNIYTKVAGEWKLVDKAYTKKDGEWSMFHDENPPVVRWKVGDIGPAGGYIFAIDSDPANTTEQWVYECAPEASVDTYPFLPAGTTLPSLTNEDFGDGIENTNTLLSVLDGLGHSDGYIAHYVNNYTRTHEGVTYDDWYLPSYAEIFAIERSLGLFVDLDNAAGFMAVSNTHNGQYLIPTFNFINYVYGEQTLPGAIRAIPVRRFKADIINVDSEPIKLTVDMKTTNPSGLLMEFKHTPVWQGNAIKSQMNENHPAYWSPNHVMYIDWGDGGSIEKIKLPFQPSYTTQEFEDFVTNKLKHTYSVEGEYQIKIWGNLDAFSFMRTPSVYDHNIISVDDWGDFKILLKPYLFTNCVNMKTIPNSGFNVIDKFLQQKNSGVGTRLGCSVVSLFNRCGENYNYTDVTKISHNYFKDFENVVNATGMLSMCKFTETYWRNETDDDNILFCKNVLKHMPNLEEASAMFRGPLNEWNTYLMKPWNIDENFFQYNTKLKRLGTFFYQRRIESIHPNAFAHLTELTDVRNMFESAFQGSWTFEMNKPTFTNIEDWFRNSTKLSRLDNLFYFNRQLETMNDLCFENSGSDANSINFTSFLYGCSNLTVKSNMFGTGTTTRFVGRNANFSNSFRDITEADPKGTAPDLWNWTFVPQASTNCFTNGANGFANWAIIPSAWGGPA